MELLELAYQITPIGKSIGTFSVAMVGRRGGAVSLGRVFCSRQCRLFNKNPINWFCARSSRRDGFIRIGETEIWNMIGEREERCRRTPCEKTLVRRLKRFKDSRSCCEGRPAARKKDRGTYLHGGTYRGKGTYSKSPTENQEMGKG